jgi:imidazolonepropionase-like amidohydrolase
MADNDGNWLPEEKAEAARGVFEAKVPGLRKAIEAGVRIGAGTDCGRHFPQSDFFAELLLLQEAGMTAEQTLLAATRENARLLGILDHLGTVEVGKIADLVLLDGNPLEDLRHSRDVRLIIQGGQALDPTSLRCRGHLPAR